jgi:hypothetical protein
LNDRTSNCTGDSHSAQDGDNDLFELDVWTDES